MAALRDATRRRAVRAAIAFAMLWCVLALLARTAAAAPPVAGASGDGAGGSAAAVAAREAQPLGPAAPASSPLSGGALAEFVRMAGALAVVIALVFAVRWWLRRTGVAIGGSGGGGAFEVLARHPVGRGQQVLVARFGPRLLCVQQTREGLRTLGELDSPEEVAQALAQIGARATVPAVRADDAERTVDLRRGKRGAR
ncbi:MAG: flagellar biosynthetic protein FliO [Phycisphaerales bacterium]